MASSPAKSIYGDTAEADDWEVLLAWRAGDGRAAELLAKRYFPLLMRFFLNKVRDAEDASELVSETFLGCSAGVERIERARSFRSFVFAIAMNKLRGYYRKQLKRQRELDDFGAVCVANAQPSSAWSLIARAQEARLLVRALRRLTLAQQIVMELSYFEELSGAEIAELLGVPRGTVHTHLHRGRQRLGAIIRELTEDPGLAGSTLLGLETWAAEVRGKIGAQ